MKQLKNAAFHCFVALLTSQLCTTIHASEFWEKTNAFLKKSKIYEQGSLLDEYNKITTSKSYQDYQSIRYDNKNYLKLINRIVNTPLHNKLRPPDQAFLNIAAKVHTERAETFKRYYSLLLYDRFETICNQRNYGKWITATGVSINGALCPLGEKIFRRDKKGFFTLNSYPLEQIEILFRSILIIHKIDKPNFGHMGNLADGLYSFLATDGFEKLDICLYDLIRALVPGQLVEGSEQLYIVNSSDDLFRRFRVSKEKQLKFLKAINRFYVHLGVGEFSFDKTGDQFKWKLTGGLHTFNGIELFTLFEINRGRRVYKKEVERSKLNKFDPTSGADKGLQILVETPRRKHSTIPLRHIKLSKGFFTNRAYKKLQPRGYKTLFSLDFTSHNAFNVCLNAFQSFLTKNPMLVDTTKPKMQTIAVESSRELKLKQPLHMGLEIGYEVEDGLLLPRTCYPTTKHYPKPS